MKKILLTIACLLTSLAMVQAVTLTWNYNSSGTPSTDFSGTSLGFAVGYGWVVQLIEYDGGYESTGSAGSIVASTTMGPNPGVPFKTYNGLSDVGDSAISVYARILDGAGNWVNLGVNGGAGSYTTAAGASTVSETFTAEGFSGTTSDTSARGTWIAIPEPGTMILFGLGSLVIAARRKFRK
jgi:hypothetical protein